MIYFDNSATTKPYPEALATYTEVASKIWGNPSSLHNLGSQATRILEVKDLKWILLLLMSVALSK